VNSIEGQSSGIKRNIAFAADGATREEAMRCTGNNSEGKQKSAIYDYFQLEFSGRSPPAFYSKWFFNDDTHRYLRGPGQPTG